MNAPTPVFAGEVMLAGWVETHNSGAKITLWLPDPKDLDAFRGLTVRKGNTAGHRFMAVLVEIGDDEEPSDKADEAIKGAARTAFKGGELAKLAGILCADEAFQEWLSSRTKPEDIGVRVSRDGSCDPLSGEEQAAHIVRNVCGVTSRAELDWNEHAATTFHDMIRKPYNAHVTGASR